MAIVDSAYDNSELELSQVLSFLSDSYGSFHALRNWSLTRMGNWKCGDNQRFSGTDPGSFSRNLHIWRDGQRILGIAVSERGEDMTIQVLPDQRNLEERTLNWVEDQWGKDKDRIVVPTFADDAWRQSVLKKRGYSMAGSRGFLRRYDTFLSPHEAPLERGFYLSDLGQTKDVDGCANVIGKASGKPSLDKEWLLSRQKASGYQPNMSVMVMSPSGRCVSYVEARIDWKQNYAEIDPIATHPDFQKRGFGRACLGECLWRLQSMRVRDAYIRSSAEPSKSHRLLDMMLPTEKVEELSWELTR